jgi:hypothetical protein
MEQIKEMWVEATGSIWPRPGKFTAGEYDFHLVKFAELIRKDCLQHLTTVGQDHAREILERYFESQ